MTKSGRAATQTAGVWPTPAKNALRCLYVIELRDVERPRTTALLCVYVGQSVYPPEIRFEQHLRGYKSARVVRKHGVALRPELTAGQRCIRDYDETLQHEAELGTSLARAGYCVHGAH